MGTSYKGGSPSFRSISDNISALSKAFSYSNGYFGVKGESGSNSRVRNIHTNTPVETAKKFYDKATYGGMESSIFNKRTGEIIGKKTKLADGSIISWRQRSSSDGSPAVDINIEKSSNSGGVKQQKIHFLKEN